MSDNTTIALITARGGSKRLPGKNIKLLGEKPLIAWTIEAALSSTHIDQVIVSTDDQEIADIARKYGAEVPFLRPKELSGDYANHYDVIAHALDWLEENNRLPDTCVLLQPTSPFRNARLIDEALRKRKQKNSESLVSVSLVNQHPSLMFRKNKDELLDSYLEPQKNYQRSQDQEELYIMNGAIYVFSTKAFRQRNKLLSPFPCAFVMSHIASLDIDNLEDFELANAFYEKIVIAE